MGEQKTVLILGGGTGGIVTANTLQKLLPRQHRIILIDREENHLFAPSLLWLMTGTRQPEQIMRPLMKLNQKGIEFIQGKIDAINPERKTVQVSGREILGDAVIISLGVDFATDAIAGLKEAGRNIYSLEGAQAVFQDLTTFNGGKIVILTAAASYKCPAAPYETAMLVEDFLQKHKLREKTQIDLYAAEAGPMLTAGPDLSAAVRSLIESKGINYHPDHQVTSVDKTSRKLTFTNDTATDFDLLFYVPLHQAPEVVKKAGLVSDSGWISVDRYTLETKFKGVYAIGDVTSIPLKIGKPLPKAGVFAHRQAEIVAHNLAVEWIGQGTKQKFDGHGECFIEVGNHRAGMGSGDFYAEPVPNVTMKQPSLIWHTAKVLFEKQWLWKWF